jgi:myo-inositol-1-phosphate synthase
MTAIKTALVGVGNCASSLIQGAEFYRDAPHIEDGLIRHKIGPYGAGDIQFVAAFDADARKAGKYLHHAPNLGRNNARSFYSTEQVCGDTLISKAPRLDGIGHSYSKHVVAVEGHEPDTDRDAGTLSDSGADVLVNFLPVGSETASRYWAEVCLKAGVAMVNAIPVFIASDTSDHGNGTSYAERFEDANIPLIGDDIKSQFGATILHRVIMRCLVDRGYVPKDTYQLNFGGNMDFINMIDGERLQSKLQSKSQSVESCCPDLPKEKIHISPSDTVRHIEDRKICYININANGYAGAPMTMELKLDVNDSPNSAGVVTEAIRLCKLAKDAGCGGVLKAASAIVCKSPRWQIEDGLAAQMVDQDIELWERTVAQGGTLIA